MIDSRIERGQQWLKTLLQLTDLPVEITAKAFGSDSQDANSYWLNIDETNLTPQQIQTLIGADGSVLDAIQYLANSILNLNQSPEQQASYTIELNGYRHNRETQIRAMAEEAAEQVRNSGTEVEIKYLSSAERRQIHTFLKEFPDLETFSRGIEPHRHLVVRLGIE